MSAVIDFLGAQAAQIAIVFVIVFALDALVARQGSVALRGALWTAFFVKLVLPPGVTSPISIARVLDQRSATADFTAQTAGQTMTPLAASLLVAVWGIGCAACLALALQRMRRSRREWLDGTRSAPESALVAIAQLSQRMGMKRAPRLLVRDDLAGAASVGLWSPVVVVPGRLVASRVALEHVLLHELGHVRRRDGLRAAVWTLARCAYWFHPLVHIAARRAALVRELACDEVAVRHTHGGAHDYQRTLLDLARPLVGATPALTGFAGMGAMITTRLERLERSTPRARRFDALPALTFALLCVCCVPLGERAIEATHLPALSDVQGCMRKRFLVMAELAKQEQLHGAAALD